jgi:acetoin utilization deacetylase AcuC-like enzyme
VLYFRSESSFDHDPRLWSPEHPDTPERIAAIEMALRARRWLGCELRDAPEATEAELRLVHTPRLIEEIQRLCLAGGGQLDEDTFVGELSFRSALHAAGGACAMARALVAGETHAAFCGLRPAGHHAERDRAMGFCLFNNVSIAAELAIRELNVERVLVIDWDVHHGNGTAEIFRRRRDVLFASIHQQHLYPGTGALADIGSGDGAGYTINIPVPRGSDGEIWLSVLEHVILEAGRRFRPELVLISAGFDAHRADPLAECRLETEVFAQMACQVRGLGRMLGAPVGAVLEGGYEPISLAESVAATVAALGGSGESESIAPDQIVTPRAATEVGRFWGF